MCQGGQSVLTVHFNMRNPVTFDVLSDPCYLLHCHVQNVYCLPIAQQNVELSNTCHPGLVILYLRHTIKILN